MAGRGPTAVVRLGLGGVVVGLAAFLGLRTPAWGKYDPLPTGPGWALLYVLVAALAVAAAVIAGRSSRRLLRWGSTAALLGLVVLVGAMTFDRVQLSRTVDAQVDPWPPRLERVEEVRLDALEPRQRAAWAVRIGAHRLVRPDGGFRQITIPASWPFPSDVELATVVLDVDHVDLWARAAGHDSAAACHSIVVHHPDPADTATRRTRCDGQQVPPPGLAWSRPPIDTDTIPAIPAAASEESWTQYRHDPLHSAVTDTPGDAPPGWTTAVDGRVRASASVVGDLVLVGGHGTGSLTALDLATGAERWVARLPNWVHQDPVSDGRIVVVGFGDNLASFAGRLPSGVAALDLATGEPLWTAFDAGSVMTSPVIHGAAIIYGTGVGTLHRRALADGALLAERVLPGMVTMAPPALVGDTLVVALDHGMACAIDAVSLADLWCHTLPDLRMVGHAAPTVDRGEVLVSGAATLATPTMSEYLHLSPWLVRDLLWSGLFPGQYEVYAGQVFAALDLHDGHVRWRSPLFANPRSVPGHTSGTAVIEDSLAVIVLPIADTLVSFDPVTGRVRWARAGHGGRGPVLVAEHRVILTGRDGVIEVRDIADGRLTCTVRRGTGWDRAGPVLAHGLVILVNLVGEVEAIPLRRLLSCDLAASRART